MEKRIYDAPKISVMEVETSSIMAGSPTYNETTTGNGSVNLQNASDAPTEDADVARVGTNKYFDSWDE